MDDRGVVSALVSKLIAIVHIIIHLNGKLRRNRREGLPSEHPLAICFLASSLRECLSDLAHSGPGSVGDQILPGALCHESPHEWASVFLCGNEG